MLHPIGADAVYHLVHVSDPHLSPDGQHLAFVRAWVDRETMQGRSQIMLRSMSDGRVELFTRGDRDSTPRISPDGSQLAFLRREMKQQRQVWLIPLHGGEARPLTEVPGGVTEFAWAPDGQSLLLVADVDPDRLPEGHDAQQDPRVKVVQRIRYRYDTLGWRGNAQRHLFQIRVGEGQAHQLTDGEWDDLSPTWSPDGQRIAFISGRRADRDIRAYTEAYVMPAAGGEPAC